MSKSTALARAELARQPRMKRVINNLPKHSPPKHFLFMELREKASHWADQQFAKTQTLARNREQVRNDIGAMERYDFALSEADREKLQGLRDESAALRAAIDEARAETNPFAEPPEQYDNAILRLGYTTRYIDSRVTATLRKGESLSDALARTRAGRDEIESAIKSIRATQVTADEVKARIVRSVDMLAKQGEPDFADCLHNRRGNEMNRVVRWPALPLDGFQRKDSGDGMALVAYLWRDEMIDALTKRALTQHTGGGLTETGRRDKLTALRTKLLEVEREEENLIERCEADGLPVQRQYRFSEDDHAQNERRLWALLGIARAPIGEEEDFG